jgi:hypothetical protein
MPKKREFWVSRRDSGSRRSLNADGAVRTNLFAAPAGNTGFAVAGLYGGSAQEAQHLRPTYGVHRAFLDAETAALAEAGEEVKNAFAVSVSAVGKIGGAQLVSLPDTRVISLYRRSP